MADHIILKWEMGECVFQRLLIEDITHDNNLGFSQSQVVRDEHVTSDQIGHLKTQERFVLK